MARLDIPSTESNQGSDSASGRAEERGREPVTHTCDRCGAGMFEHGCKIICPNCGHRFDCSDLNLYFD